MKPAPLLPALPFHDDEVTQSYFARIGHFHAGVGISQFCRYIDLPPSNVCDGTDIFLRTTAALSGLNPAALGHNLMRRLPGGRFLLRGESLAMPVLRRSAVRFCPKCLTEDLSREPGLGDGAGRQRWSWLLRPVVCCPIHQAVLVGCSERDIAKTFDLSLLQARNEAALQAMPLAVHHLPGRLQSYVVARLEGRRDASAWLDGQPLAQAVKACEMLGSLVAGGPRAAIQSFTEIDWAGVGDVGFGICTNGADAIGEALTSIRRNSSGRGGPQAIFGQLFIWLQYAPKAENAGPIRDVLREVILDSFAIEPGEAVLGKVVDKRRAHTVISLSAASGSGLGWSRLQRLIQKSGIVPEDSNAEMTNHRLLPADESEKLIERIQNSIPQNQLPNVLGCSQSQAKQLVEAGLVTSVVPTAKGRIGLSVGAFNRDELTDFLASLCAKLPVVAEDPEGYFSLGLNHTSQASNAEILRWQLDGLLRRTLRIGLSHRLDCLRFYLDEVRTLARARCRTEVHRLEIVAVRLGVSRKVVKQLVSAEVGAPLLALASLDECQGLHGKAYVSSTEIERFKADYLTLGQAAEAIGRHANSAKWLLDRSLSPVCDPAVLGVRLYRRQDIEAFLVKSRTLVSVPASLRGDPLNGATTANNLTGSTEEEGSGEIYGSNL